MGRPQKQEDGLYKSKPWDSRNKGPKLTGTRQRPRMTARPQLISTILKGKEFRLKYKIPKKNMKLINGFV